jgi:hypothetical protein
MDERVRKLKTPEDCVRFAANALRLNHPDLADQARERAVELRAAAYGASTDAERECLEAVYAYETVLTSRNGKTTKASRTWQMIKRHGIFEAVERAINRREETIGYTVLLEMGLQRFAFESVVMRHPTLFSPETVQRSSERTAEWARTAPV